MRQFFAASTALTAGGSAGNELTGRCRMRYGTARPFTVICPVDTSASGAADCCAHAASAAKAQAATSEITLTVRRGPLFFPLAPRNFIFLVSQRLAGLERECNPLLRLALAAQRQERLTLQVKHVLLADQRSRRHTPAAQHICCPASHL